jgi:glycolate oxidase FAD binding subunit
MARWLLASSLSPERIDWQQSEGSTGLLISLASISAQTLNEQIACVRERAQQLRVDPLDPEALRQRVAEGQGDRAANPAAWLLRLGVQPDRLDILLQERALAAIPWCFAAGSGLGMVWAARERLAGHQVEQLRRRCHDLSGHLIVLSQPAGSRIPAWLDAPSRPLIEAIKRQFDPRQQLARGRLPGVQPASEEPAR